MRPYRTPNYCLKSAHTYSVGSMDTRVIEAGTFVRPVEEPYVPKHVMEDKRWSHYDKSRHVFIYYRYGFVLVPKDLVRET